MTSTRRRSRKRKTVIAVILSLAVLIAISGLNKPHFSPFSVNLKLNYPSSYVQGKKNSAIIDMQGRRLLILNEDGRIHKIVKADASGSPVERFNGAIVVGDKIYVFGSTHYNGGIYLSSEKLIRYSTGGSLEEVIYEKKYDETAMISSPLIRHLSIADNGLIISCAADKTVNVYRYDTTMRLLASVDFPEPISDCGFDAASNCILVHGLFQGCYYADLEQQEPLETEFEITKAGYIYDTANDEATDSLPKTIALSLPLILENLLFWNSVALLTVSTLLLLLWQLRHQLTNRAKIVILVMGGILITAFFYTKNGVYENEKAYQHSLKVQAGQIAISITDRYGSVVNDIRNEGVKKFCTDPDNQAQLEELDKYITKLSLENGLEHSCHINTFLTDTNGELYSFIGSGRLLSGDRMGITQETLNSLRENPDSIIFTETSYFETYDYALKPIFTDNEISGLVVVSSPRGNIVYNCTKTAVELFVTLAAIFLVLYVSITSLRIFRRKIESSSERRDSEDYIGKFLDMSGLLMFVNCLSYFLDSTVVVYIAKSLCENMSPNVQAALAALPIAVAAAGALIGNLSFPKLRQKLGERRLALIAATVNTAALLITFYAVYSRSIILYIAGKFVFGLCSNGLIFVLCDTIPFTADSTQTQRAGINTNLRNVAAASIIATLAGGYISKYFSYAAIYILAAALAVLWCVIAVRVFEKAKPPVSHNKAVQSSIRANWSAFLKGPMLTYFLFYSVPYILVEGYESYLFPMYTASVGMSALLLSKLSVFAKAFVFGNRKNVVYITENISNTGSMLFPMFIVCGGLICFILSPNIYWAVLMLFLFKFMLRLTRVGKKMYVNEIAMDNKLDPKIVQANCNSIELGLEAIQTPVLSAFMSMGINTACTVVGAICAVIFGLFGRYCRNREK